MDWAASPRMDVSTSSILSPINGLQLRGSTSLPHLNLDVWYPNLEWAAPGRKTVARIDSLPGAMTWSATHLQKPFIYEMRIRVRSGHQHRFQPARTRRT